MKFMSRLLVLLLLFLSTLICHSQEFSKVAVKNWDFKKVQIPVSAYVVDGEVFKSGKDHTVLLQDILNKYQIVVLPSKQININSQGISLRNNCQLFFQVNTVVKMIANSNGTYAMFKVRGVNNIKIYNPQLVGDRIEHKGNSGEWGMGIDIRSSSNIVVYNPFIRNMWGDGIYLGIQNAKKSNENISIEGGIIDYSRRNGISITSGKDIHLNNIEIYNTYGTNPMAGIDIEPNKDSDLIKNVSLKNIITCNNRNEGILLYLSNLRHIKDKEASIRIINHIDTKSGVGLKIGPISYQNASGGIIISNSKWSSNKKAALQLSDISKTKVSVDFSDCYIDSKKISSSISNNKSVNKASMRNLTIK